MLLYANDMALLAASPGDLQLMLNHLHAFSTEDGLTVNVSENKPVVYGNNTWCPHTPAEAAAWPPSTPASQCRSPPTLNT